MLVSPSKAAGPWKENRRDGNIWRNLQPYPGHYAQLWRQLRHRPEVQYNTAYALTTFPETYPSLLTLDFLLS